MCSPVCWFQCFYFEFLISIYLAFQCWHHNRKSDWRFSIAQHTICVHLNGKISWVSSDDLIRMATVCAYMSIFSKSSDTEPLNWINYLPSPWYFVISKSEFIVRKIYSSNVKHRTHKVESIIKEKCEKFVVAKCSRIENNLWELLSVTAVQFLSL